MYLLTKKLIFPPPDWADPDGMLAVGGDLSVERLLLAYQMGIFPWFSRGEPILWWSPDPRFVLFPAELKVSKSMKQVFKKGQFTITLDTRFEEVVNTCRHIKRQHQSGTWITPAMAKAYGELHQAGYAHSIEVWDTQTGALAGGLYGISLGAHFYGESMFSRQSNASKVGFITLVHLLAQRGFTLIDCQMHTQHLESLGARNIPRSDFLQLLAQNQYHPTLTGKWHWDDYFLPQ